ncbi:unnamed protein product [Caenorhabditis auriculariae]|uniref:Uncharacterized protein n=1 Tax=Caenorhabditis auriculariae TaxID=2777116 RepID=A0A8S1H2N5_9PELO|nr:unnamed protein product [Caenorhabditis auriculariae]
MAQGEAQNLGKNESETEKEATLDRTLTKLQATYQRLGLGLHRTLEPEAKASDSGSTAILWSLGLRSSAWALKAWAGDSASDSRDDWEARDWGPRPATRHPRGRSGSGSDPAGHNQKTR